MSGAGPFLPDSNVAINWSRNSDASKFKPPPRSRPLPNKPTEMLPDSVEAYNWYGRYRSDRTHNAFIGEPEVDEWNKRQFSYIAGLSTRSQVQFNAKCVIQSILLVLAIIAARNIPQIETHWAALALCGVVLVNYWLMAFLDLSFGCEHGDFFRELMGDMVHSSMRK